MSTERIIHLADLTFIHNSLRGLHSDISTVSDQVEGVGQQVSTTRSELQQLEQLVRDFIAADMKAKELQLAETRQVKIRQELETKFGYYAEVRRQATGILQAADVSIVRKETITSATEELMLSTPRYWLAPALVALAAWLNDNQGLATKALSEALRRDDEKTSLFFSLVTRRAARGSACATWLDRYFGMQDPTQLDRQTVVLVDALASGVFGPEVRSRCAERIEAWIEELSQRAGFVDEQRTQWNTALRSKIPSADNDRYGYLSKYSPTWPMLNDVLNGAAMHAIVHSYFSQVFKGAIPPSPNIQAAVDDLLDKLVKNFDDEELPLRRDERLCQLIIDEGGNRTAAANRYALESKALDEQVSFTQLLTNAAMHPEASKASKATQRFAIALSKNWIRDAHLDLTASIRAAVPVDVDLEIEGWKGQTRDGDNESALIPDLENHIEQKKEETIASMKLDIKHWAGLTIGALLIVLGLPSMNWLMILLGAGAVIWFFSAKSGIAKARQKVAEDFAKLKEQSVQILRAALAEVVELRRDFLKRDALSHEVTKLLDGITPQQYVLSSHDNVRQVMAQPTA
ncbi:hypothetical protein [Noviherbaspirillum pedocola]|uniref:Uncharacterized protein n=1 Tax=Noviherbaspirillum pedocola TaxID=2801341 RepID=A0A934STJ1_9BURK|nr:hypothetical protein [Noviherbaspirillum pedocola]MBK4735244.1 hypothetical protein [Noviherbaspirillum pedocola]